MEKSKELVTQAGIVPTLKLATQRPGGGVSATGPHTVTVISESLINTTQYETGEKVATMRYFFEEAGEKKQYDVEVKDKNGNLHYLIQRMAEFKPGDVLTMECIRKGARNYISVQKVDEDIPVIEDGRSDFQKQIEA